MYDSHYARDYLHKFNKQYKGKNPIYCNVEHICMKLCISFLLIRKLIECNKISERTINISVPLSMYKLSDTNYNRCTPPLYGYDAYEYDKNITYNIKEICNLFVHCTLCSIEFDGTIVLSRSDINDYRVYKLPLSATYDIFDMVVSDYPSTIIHTMTQKNNKHQHKIKPTCRQ